MKPLDLTVRPPRGPRETLLGCAFLPRTIDKMRAELPGGKLGAYVVTGKHTISGWLLHKLKIDPDEMRGVVGRAASEDEVVAWLRERVDPAAAAEITAKLEASRVDTLPPQHWEFVAERHPMLRTRSDLTTTYELLEADDAANFAEDTSR
jgi:hypothetical protein